MGFSLNIPESLRNVSGQVQYGIEENLDKFLGSHGVTRDDLGITHALAVVPSEYPSTPNKEGIVFEHAFFLVPFGYSGPTDCDYLFANFPVARIFITDEIDTDGERLVKVNCWLRDPRKNDA